MKSFVIAVTLAFAAASPAPALAHQGGGHQGGHQGGGHAVHENHSHDGHGFRGGRFHGGYGPDNCGQWFGGIFVPGPCY
jgi:opacity protein-like surface antigen